MEATGTATLIRGRAFRGLEVLTLGCLAVFSVGKGDDVRVCFEALALGAAYFSGSVSAFGAGDDVRVRFEVLALRAVSFSGSALGS